MKSSREIRADARKALGENGQYLRYVASYLLLCIMAIAISLPLMAILGVGIGISGIAPFFAPGGQCEIGLFLDPAVMLPLLTSVLLVTLLAVYPIGYLKWGENAMSIAAMRRGLTVGHTFSGWGHGWKMGWIVTVKLSCISLWTLLLVVPGVVKALSYAMTEFIAIDHPDWSAGECMAESQRLMNGNRMNYLILCVSFIGWFALLALANAFTPAGGIAQWFFMPYFNSAKAAFYENLLDCDIVE